MLGLCQDRCCCAVLQSGLLKGSGFRLNLPVGIGRELLLLQIVPAMQFDCSPASGCGGTTGVREEEEGSAVCGLGMEWPAGVGMSQTSSAAEASLSSSWATTACFIWKHLVKENKLYFRDGFSTVESHRRPFVSTYVCVLWSRSAPDGREHRALSCLGKMPLQGS